MQRGWPLRRPRTEASPETSPVATTTLLLLRRCLVTGRFGSVVFAPPELAEAGSFLDLLLDTHLHRPLKSLAFLREMGEQSS